MKTTPFLFLMLLLFSTSSQAQTVPTPDHVVILMLENYGYSDIIGNTHAPYINSLLKDSNTANFTQSFALTHPSQPNYLLLYSGSNQGVTTDAIPTNTPFTTCNLGASLIAKGKTFGAYSEGLPSVGSLASTFGSYARKHCPWTNWQGTGVNQVPATVNMPFTSFPSTTTFSTLPTVSFVIPNLDNDMHNPSDPNTAIQNGDIWVSANMDAYIKWAKTHNSLLILDFDEDDGGNNQITTIFIGAMVKAGTYAEHIDHYTVLRTIEDMYGITNYCGPSSTATPITDCWKTPTGISKNQAVKGSFNMYPNPTVGGEITIEGLAEPTQLMISNELGQTLFDMHLVANQKHVLDVSTWRAGLYSVRMQTGFGETLTKKLLVP